MPKERTEYKCSNCGKTYVQWVGKCSKCNEFGTIEEVVTGGTNGKVVAGTKTTGGPTASTPAMRIKEVKADSSSHQTTGISELDRVLGGGLVKGGVVLLAGPPGTGKSSILAKVSHNYAETVGPALYVSGEESAQQIKIRHQRMSAMSDNLYLAPESELSKVLWQIDEVQPKLLIIDSLQTISSKDIEGSSGSVSQVKEVANVITHIAKERGIPTIIVGHSTKDGSVAGPRTVEHLVDVVLFFEGEQDSPIRVLRGEKNRFGPADEVGYFEHTETGLEEVIDPSGLLLSEREESVTGAATTIYLEGKRAVPVEIQSLVIESMLPNPRKITSGLDGARSITLQAIIQKHYRDVRLGSKDVHIATSGGLRVKDPGTDLATAFSICSDALGIPARHDAVYIGEVTLPGEVRRVNGMVRRLEEARRLGFKAAVVPKGTRASLTGPLREANDFVIMEVGKLSDLFKIFQGFANSYAAGALK